MTWSSGFHKKSPLERRRALITGKNLSKSSQDSLDKDAPLSLELANHFAEQVIATYQLPYAILPEITINHTAISLPMVTEEPSVIAAASYAGKFIGRCGGIITHQEKRGMIGQVALYDIPNVPQAITLISQSHQKLLELANAAYPSIVSRGGGAKFIHLEEKEDFLIVYLHVDTQEAMGANMLNTMLEAIAPRLEELSHGTSLMAILSNLATDSLVSATCHIPISRLAATPEDANRVAKRFEKASQLAQLDPYRAATHNKGIFNGIDALAIACGQDWRAIEASCQAYAAKKGTYQGLATWHIANDVLIGEMTLPLATASVGGSIGLHPMAQTSFDIMGHPNAKELATYMISLGLCQNFAALKALVTSGIQKGHMKLQAKALALQAGASPEKAAKVAEKLYHQSYMNLETATEILTKEE